MKLPTINALLLLATASVVDAYSFVPSRWGTSAHLSAKSVGYKPARSSSLVMSEKEPFTLGTLFGGNKAKDPSASNPIKKLRGPLEPHPSVRPHVSPLNRLSKDAVTVHTESEPLPMHPLVKSGVLDNGMSYVILPNKSPPGRFEAHLQVFSGSGKWLLL
jgi:hypothetical protein